MCLFSIYVCIGFIVLPSILLCTTLLHQGWNVCFLKQRNNNGVQLYDSMVNFYIIEVDNEFIITVF